MAFLGPNGAGKTSTIDMILGPSRPDAGAVEVYGMAPRQAVRKGLVSAVMQSGGLLKDLTVAETAQYTARLFAVSRPVGEVLEQMRKEGHGCALVTRAGHLIGIFTERDVLLKVIDRPESWTTPIDHVMTPQPHTVGPTDSVATALRLMNCGHYRNVPVVDADGTVR